MKKVFSYFVCVCLTALLTLGSLFAGKQVNPNGNKYKDYFVTYKMPYLELEQELLYARIVRYTADGKETTALLRDKGQLVAIVREFDRLKADKSFHSPPGRSLEESFVVTMWRQGRSVSYVVRGFSDGYYYQERSMGGLADDEKRQAPGLKRLTPALVRLLGPKPEASRCPVRHSLAHLLTPISLISPKNSQRKLRRFFQRLFQEIH